MGTYIQVNPQHYLGHLGQDYDGKHRFISYWHQINEIAALSPKSVLEVGIGNRFVSDYLTQRGLDVLTLDVDRRLGPRVTGNVLGIPLRAGAFEVVACYEVLEHLPYDDFRPALLELLRVTQRYVLLSLPDRTRYCRIKLALPLLGRLEIMLSRLPRLRTKRHQYDGQHYWEIGKDGYSLNHIIREMTSLGCNLKKTYRIFEHPYHRFFLLEKS